MHSFIFAAAAGNTNCDKQAYKHDFEMCRQDSKQSEKLLLQLAHWPKFTIITKSEAEFSLLILSNQAPLSGPEKTKAKVDGIMRKKKKYQGKQNRRNPLFKIE